MIQQTLQSTRGSALVVAMGAITVVATAMLIASSQIENRVDAIDDNILQAQAESALQLVMSKRQNHLMDLTESGDAEVFYTWSSNYGEDAFAGFRVRWKIEPAIISNVAEDTPTSEDFEYVTNPPPASDTGLAPEQRVENNFIYIYRIAAEAQYLGNDGEDVAPWDTPPYDSARAVAQGVKFVVIRRNPVFRNVLFYAQEGPAGDCELTHSDLLTIRGDVQVNGALYIGGTPYVKARQGKLFNATSTTVIGPRIDGDEEEPVRVKALDGIFRLNKPMMYEHFLETGNDADYLSIDSPLDDYEGVYGTFTERTWIDPYRVSDALATYEDGDEDESRTINNYSIIGKGTDSNDSRGSASDFSWVPDSLGDATTARGFEGYARSRETGALTEKIADDLLNRPLEAQAVQYGDDPTDHDGALPLFVDGAGTTNELPSGAVVREEPGAMLSNALGSAELVMTRLYADSTISDKNDPTDLPPILDGSASPGKQVANQWFTGWTVTTRDGSTPDNPSATAPAGLVIRERPTPVWGDDSIWGVKPDVVSTTADDFQPYNYGKNYKTQIWPFTELWVSGEINPKETNMKDHDYRYAYFTRVGRRRWQGNLVSKGIQVNEAYELTKPFSYEFGGTIKVGTTVEAPPENIAARKNWYISKNSWFDDGSRWRDPLGLFLGCWRFIHLKRPVDPDDPYSAPVTPADRDVTEVNPWMEELWFDPNTFQSVQLRIADFDGGSESDHIPGVWEDTNGDGFRQADEVVPFSVDTFEDPSNPYHKRKAGIMLREVNIDASKSGEEFRNQHNDVTSLDQDGMGFAATGRHTALLFSPERGVFTERRVRGISQKNDFLGYYTGTGSSGYGWPPQTKLWLSGTHLKRGTWRRKFGKTNDFDKNQSLQIHTGTNLLNFTFAVGSSDSNSGSNVSYVEQEAVSNIQMLMAFEFLAGTDLSAVGGGFQPGDGNQRILFYDPDSGVSLSAVPPSGTDNRAVLDTRSTSNRYPTSNDFSYTKTKYLVHDDSNLMFHDWGDPRLKIGVMLESASNSLRDEFISSSIAANSAFGLSTSDFYHKTEHGAWPVPKAKKFSIDGDTNSEIINAGYDQAQRKYEIRVRGSESRGTKFVATKVYDMVDGTYVYLKEGDVFYGRKDWNSAVNNMNVSGNIAAKEAKLIDYITENLGHRVVRQITSSEIEASMLINDPNLYKWGEASPDQDWVWFASGDTDVPWPIQPLPTNLFGGFSENTDGDSLNVASGRQTFNYGESSGNDVKYGGAQEVYFAIERKNDTWLNSWMSNAAVDQSDKMPYHLAPYTTIAGIPPVAFTSAPHQFVPYKDGATNSGEGWMDENTQPTTVVPGFGPYLEDLSDPTSIARDTDNNPINLTGQRWLTDVGTTYADDASYTGDTWLRIEMVDPTRVSSSPGISSGNNWVRYKYYQGPLVPPTTEAASRAWPHWRTILRADSLDGDPLNPSASEEMRDDLSRMFYLSDTHRLSIGLALQSGDKNATPLEVTFEDVRIFNEDDQGNKEVIDSNCWESNAGSDSGSLTQQRTPNPVTAWLASQYQVFFGGIDITQDFFLYNQDANNSLSMLERVQDITGQEPTSIAAWAAGETYTATSFVELEGVYYQSLLGHTAAEDNKPESGAGYWTRIEVPGSIALEQWMYNPRKFWSSSRFWNEDDAVRSDWIERETGLKYGDTDEWAPFIAYNKGDVVRYGVEFFEARQDHNSSNSIKPNLVALQDQYWLKRRFRELGSRVSVLKIDMESLQDYLAHRYVNQAGTGFKVDLPPGSGEKLLDAFNGLVTVYRTNRFPVNPRAGAIGVDKGLNPWNPDLPNSTDGALVGPWWDSANYITKDNYEALNPYTTSVIPSPLPIRCVDFNHAVMFHNADRLDVGYRASVASGETPVFGSNRLSLSTNAACYLQGDFNSVKTEVVVDGEKEFHVTPVGVFADNVTLLSNAFNIADYRRPGVHSSDNGQLLSNVPESDSDAYAKRETLMKDMGFDAVRTTYNAALLVSHQPTTKERVQQGQTASIMNNFQLLENWPIGEPVTFMGSLVVWDINRYSDDYMSGGVRLNGRSPFGLLNDAGHIAMSSQEEAIIGYRETSTTSGPDIQSGFKGPVPVFGGANLQISMTFNDGLRTEEGTPPFTPTGVTATGAGAWIETIK